MRRFDSVPSSARSNAVRCGPNVSAATSHSEGRIGTQWTVGYSYTTRRFSISAGFPRAEHIAVLSFSGT